MPKRIINDDYVWKGVIYAARRNERGLPVETDVEVPEDFPAHVGREPGASPFQNRTSSTSSTSSTGATMSENAQGGAGTTGGSEPVDYEGMTKAELEALVEQRGLSEQVQGSGANGGVLKSDLVDALTAADQQTNQGAPPPPAA